MVGAASRAAHSTKAEHDRPARLAGPTASEPFEAIWRIKTRRGGCFSAVSWPWWPRRLALPSAARVLDDWGVQFGLTEEQKGIISGVGLYPFAISIILFSLIIDRIGYGTAMVFAFVGHLASTLLTIFAPNFRSAVHRDVHLRTVQRHGRSRDQSGRRHDLQGQQDPLAQHPARRLAGRLVLGGLLAIGVSKAGTSLGTSLPGELWQWQMGMLCCCRS